MSHRCGKHVLLSTPASTQSGWIACQVHRMGTTRLNAIFTRVITLEFAAEELLLLHWTTTHAMLDTP